MTGSVNEEGFPVTDKAMVMKSQGAWDGFISIFNSDDMTLAYSSLVGGKDADHIISAHFLGPDTVVIGGITTSPDFPLTENALFKEYPAWEKTFNGTFFGRRKPPYRRRSRLLTRPIWGMLRHTGPAMPPLIGRLVLGDEAKKK